MSQKTNIASLSKVIEMILQYLVVQMLSQEAPAGLGEPCPPKHFIEGFNMLDTAELEDSSRDASPRPSEGELSEP